MSRVTVTFLVCENKGGVNILLDKFVDIKWHNSTKNWYTNHGYEFTHNGDTFTVKTEDLTPGSNVRINCTCDYCGSVCNVQYKDYVKNTRNSTIKFACVSCRGEKFKEYGYDGSKQKYFKNFLRICDEKGYTPISTIDECKTLKTKVRYICPLHGEQESIYYNMSKGSGCPRCAQDLINQKNRLPIEKVMEIVESKNNNKLLNPEEYDKVKTNNLKVQCGKCGEIFITSLSSIMAGGGACRKCGLENLSEKMKLSIDNVIDTIEEKNNNILLNPEDYIGSNTNNLLIKCGNCGNVFKVSFSNYKRNITGRCPDCNERSIGEYLIAGVLDKLGIRYNRQQTFDGCVDKKYMPFDFYLPDYNLCIEFDGQQHFHPWYGEENFMNVLLHDAMKNNFCAWNNIDLLRIPYWKSKDIEIIIKNRLNLVA